MCFLFFSAARSVQFAFFFFFVVDCSPSLVRAPSTPSTPSLVMFVPCPLPKLPFLSPSPYTETTLPPVHTAKIPQQQKQTKITSLFKQPQQQEHSTCMSFLRQSIFSKHTPPKASNEKKVAVGTNLLTDTSKNKVHNID